MKLNTPLGRLRILAIFEGISYLLFAITMPLKYNFEITEPNYVVGMIHGILFVLYGLQCIQVIFRYKWSFSRSFYALLAALIPAGTFVADALIFKKVQHSPEN